VRIEGVARPLHPRAAHHGAGGHGRQARALRGRPAPAAAPPPGRARRRAQARAALAAQGERDPRGGVMSDDNPYSGLRSMALGQTAETLKLHGLKPGDCSAIRMEMGSPKAVLPLACFLTGDRSLYTSNGGGIIG